MKTSSCSGNESVYNDVKVHDVKVHDVKVHDVYSEGWYYIATLMIL